MNEPDYAPPSADEYDPSGHAENNAAFVVAIDHDVITITNYRVGYRTVYRRNLDGNTVYIDETCDVIKVVDGVTE